MSDSERHPAERRALFLLPLIVLGTCLAYLNVIHGEFQFDDYIYIPSSIRLSTALETLRTDFLGSLIGGQRVVTNLTFGLNHALGGMAVEGYHLVNILLHLATVVLVWSFLRRLLRRPGMLDDASASLSWAPLVVASIFALHPLQTQAVSYVAQRSEVLSSLFYLLTLLCLLRFVEGRGSRGGLWWGAGMVLFLLGWASKEVVATVPVALVVCSLFLLDRSRVKRAALAASPFVLVGAVVGVWEVSRFTPAGGAGFDLEGLGQPAYFLTQLPVLVTYLRLFLWPSGQNIDHDFPVFQSIGEPRVLLAASFWALVLVGIGISLRIRGRFKTHARLAGFGMLWFLLVLAPTSSLVPLADVIVEHRVYLALLGLALTAVALADLARQIISERTRGRLPDLVWLPIVVLLLSGLGMATYRRNLVWQTKLSLWEDAASKSPAKSRPQNNLGNCYYLLGDYSKASSQYRHAIALDPRNREAYYNLSISLRKLGRQAEADRYLKEYLSFVHP